jgi:hypothetical protein
MSLTTSTFSIFHFKYEQIIAIPLSENLRMFLKVGRAEKDRTLTISQFLLGMGYFCHPHFYILILQWLLKTKSSLFFSMEKFHKETLKFNRD